MPNLEEQIAELIDNSKGWPALSSALIANRIFTIPVFVQMRQELEIKEVEKQQKQLVIDDLKKNLIVQQADLARTQRALELACMAQASNEEDAIKTYVPSWTSDIAEIVKIRIQHFLSQADKEKP